MGLKPLKPVMNLKTPTKSWCFFIKNEDTIGFELKIRPFGKRIMKINF